VGKLAGKEIIFFFELKSSKYSKIQENSLRNMPGHSLGIKEIKSRQETAIN